MAARVEHLLNSWNSFWLFLFPFPRANNSDSDSFKRVRQQPEIVWRRGCCQELFVWDLRQDQHATASTDRKDLMNPAFPKELRAGFILHLSCCCCNEETVDGGQLTQDFGPAISVYNMKVTHP